MTGQRRDRIHGDYPSQSARGWPVRPLVRGTLDQPVRWPALDQSRSPLLPPAHQRSGQHALHHIENELGYVAGPGADRPVHLAEGDQRQGVEQYLLDYHLFVVPQQPEQVHARDLDVPERHEELPVHDHVIDQEKRRYDEDTEPHPLGLPCIEIEAEWAHDAVHDGARIRGRLHGIEVEEPGGDDEEKNAKIAEPQPAMDRKGSAHHEENDGVVRKADVMVIRDRPDDGEAEKDEVVRESGG